MLLRIELHNFRCIEHADLTFDDRGTGLVGPNASGKTSLLESIFFLGQGRSFRTSERVKVLGPMAPFFRVVGEVMTSRGKLTVGSEYSDGKTNTKLAGRPIASMAEIAEILPLQLIDPSLHRLVEEGSARRRRLLDWGVFHVKHDFLQHWRRYQRALHQRNMALRALIHTPALLQAWEREMSVCGEAVDNARAEYIELVSPHFCALSSTLLSGATSLEYRRGWAMDQTLDEALENSRPRDQKLRTTGVGPHRADITFRIRGVVARDLVSRGQQKMLASAFVLAQIRLRAANATVPTCLLLDDPAAELDVDNLGKLLRAIDSVPSQLIITSVSEGGLQGMHLDRKFHVEQGRFTQML